MNLYAALKGNHIIRRVANYKTPDKRGRGGKLVVVVEQLAGVLDVASHQKEA